MRGRANRTIGITIPTKAQYLESDGLTVFTDSRGSECYIALAPGAPINIRLEEDGEYVRMMVRSFATIHRYPRADEVRKRLLHTNYTLKLVKVRVDMSDGEVMFEIGFPVEDGVLTEKQLTRRFRAMVMALRRSGDRLRDLIDAGHWDDEDKDSEIRRFMEQMPSRGGIPKRPDLSGLEDDDDG